MKWQCSNLPPETQASDRKSNCAELHSATVTQTGISLSFCKDRDFVVRAGSCDSDTGAGHDPGVKRQQASWTANLLVLCGGCPCRVAHQNSEMVVPFSACG